MTGPTYLELAVMVNDAISAAERATRYYCYPDQPIGILREVDDAAEAARRRLLDALQEVTA